MSAEERARAALADAAEAWRRFVAAREAMNAAVPDVVNGTPAEYALYHERYAADHDALREHYRTALALAQHADAIIAAETAAYERGFRAGFAACEDVGVLRPGCVEPALKAAILSLKDTPK